MTAAPTPTSESETSNLVAEPPVAEVPAPDTETDHHDHPTDWAYIKIALVLAVITAVEVFTYFESVFSWGRFLVPSLILMMIVKFWLVATWFMHLKFDKPIFAKMFVGGLVLAVGVYVATLTAFEFWG